MIFWQVELTIISGPVASSGEYKFDQGGIQIVAYSVDEVILESRNFLQTISKDMNASLDELSSWAKNKGLTVKPSKTEQILSTRRYKVEKFLLPELDAVEQ